MSGNRVGFKRSAASLTRSTLLVTLGFILLLIQPGRGQAPNQLTFFKNYFLTGDYVARGIPLKNTGSGGFAVNKISFPATGQPGALPANAYPVAAFFYWSTVVSQTDIEAGLIGAKFRGKDISGIGKVLNPFGTNPCWSSGGGAGGGAGDGSKKLVIQRADVLRFFEADADGNILINGDNGLEHRFELPDSGQGNVVPFTLGASLVVVYRHHEAAFRGIVIYDGGFTLSNQADKLTQPVLGWYQPSLTDRNAKATMIVSDGQLNFTDRVLFTDPLQPIDPNTQQPKQNLIKTDAFVSGWDTVSFDIPLSANAASATLTIDHGNSSTFDCVTGGVAIVSTGVRDTDRDGLLDVWETSGEPRTDPNTNQPLPDLKAMGANPLRKDLFVELNALQTETAPEPITYGTGGDAIPDLPGGHNHMPSKDVLKRIANVFEKAPIKNPYDGYQCGKPGQPICQLDGIQVHFDAGDIGQSEDDKYIVPVLHPTTDQPLARGGESIPEEKCPVFEEGECRFPDYPGTIGSAGLYTYKNLFFDRNRKDTHHYALIPHALGEPSNGNPKKPKKTSGKAQRFGGNFMVTLGFWGNNFLGPIDVFVATFVHEIGHNFGRGHSGDTFDPNELNCNPNYLSVMNYMFQTQLLRNRDGEAVVDLSSQQLPPINESGLPAGLGTMAYRTSWYAPKSTVHQSLGTTIATKHCDGTAPLSTDVPMVRIDGTSAYTPPTNPNTVPQPYVVASIDWNGNLNLTDDAGPTKSQDVSFNGTTNGAANLLRGSDDWSFIANFGLRQLGSRRAANGSSLDVTADDVGREDPGREDPGREDPGREDPGREDPGREDPGKELDFDEATSVGHPPHSLKAVPGDKIVTLTWRPPTLPHTDGPTSYVMYRVQGSTFDAVNFQKREIVTGPITTLPDGSLQLIDSKVKPATIFTYGVIAIEGPSQSGLSNFATVTTLR